MTANLPELPQRPARIDVQRRSEADEVGYRDAFEQRDELVIRWHAFLWFNLMMVLVTGGVLPVATAAIFGPAALALVALPAYVLLAVLVDRATVRIDDTTITTSLGPLPLLPKRIIAVADVVSVQATQQLTSRSGWSESTNVAWYVAARTKTAGQVAITRTLRRQSEAEYVAKLIMSELQRHR